MLASCGLFFQRQFRDELVGRDVANNEWGHCWLSGTTQELSPTHGFRGPQFPTQAHMQVGSAGCAGLTGNSACGADVAFRGAVLFASCCRQD